MVNPKNSLTHSCSLCSVVYKKVLYSYAIYYKVPLVDYILIYKSAQRRLISMWRAKSHNNK